MRGVLKPGDWSPGSFPPAINLTVTLTLFTIATARGFDYFLGDSPMSARRLSEIESAAPLWVWGAYLITAACIGFTAVFLRHAMPLVWAHVMCWAAYWALSVGIFIDVYQREHDAKLIDEWVVVTLLLGAALALTVWRNATWEHAPLLAVALMVAVSFAVAAVDWDGIRNAVSLLGIGMVHAVMGTGTASVARSKKLIAEGG